MTSASTPINQSVMDRLWTVDEIDAYNELVTNLGGANSMALFVNSAGQLADGTGRVVGRVKYTTPVVPEPTVGVFDNAKVNKWDVLVHGERLGSDEPEGRYNELMFTALMALVKEYFTKVDLYVVQDITESLEAWGPYQEWLRH